MKFYSTYQAYQIACCFCATIIRFKLADIRWYGKITDKYYIEMNPF